MKTETVKQYSNDLGYESDARGLEFLQLLSYIQLNETRGYFHSIDGSYWSFFQVSGLDDTLFSQEDKYGVSLRFNKSFLDLIPGSGVGYFKFTNTDIRSRTSRFIESSKDDKYSHLVTKAISNHQFSAAHSEHGFEYNVSREAIEHAMEEEDKRYSDAVGGAGSSTSRAIRRGFKPTNSVHIIGIRWTPKAIGSDKIIKNIVEELKAAIGVTDPNELYKQKYIGLARQFVAAKDKFVQNLSSTGMAIKECNGQDLVDVLYSFMNPIRCKDVPPPRYKNRMTIKDILHHNIDIRKEHDNNLNAHPIKSAFTVKPEGIDIHTPGEPDYYYRTVSCTDFEPGHKPDYIASEFLGDIEGDGLVSMHAEFENSSVLLMTLNFLIGQEELKKNVMSSRLLSIFSDQEKLDQKIYQLKNIKKITNTDDDRLKQIKANISFSYTAGGTNLSEIKNRLKTAETAFDNNGVVEDVNGSAIIHSFLPGNFRDSTAKKLARQRPALSGDYALMIPCFVSFIGANSDAILVNNRDGDPIYIDLFNDKDTKTGHSLVVGATGTGKSFTFIYLLFNLARKYKLKAWILDKGGSFRRPISALGGEYQQLNTGGIKDKPITCINPFAMVSDENVDTDKAATHIKNTIDVLLEVLDNQTLTAAEGHIVYQACIEYVNTLNSGEEGNLTDYFENHLRKQKNSAANGNELADRLGAIYGKGQYAKLFDGASTLDWSSNIIGFDIAAADNKILPAILNMLFGDITDTCTLKLPLEVVKLIIIDEAWAALSKKGIISVVSGYYRELRKFRGACVLISQTILEFVKMVSLDSSEDTDGILANVNHFFLMAVSEQDYIEAEKELGFRPYEIAAWKTLQSAVPFYAEVFYRRRATNDQYYSGIFRIYSPPLLYWLSTTKAQESQASANLEKRLVEEKNISPKEAVLMASEQLARKYPYGL